MRVRGGLARAAPAARRAARAHGQLGGALRLCTGAWRCASQPGSAAHAARVHRRPLGAPALHTHPAALRVTATPLHAAAAAHGSHGDRTARCSFTCSSAAACCCHTQVRGRVTWACNRCRACTSTLMYSSLAVRGALGHSQPGSAQPLQPGCALCCRQCFVGAATRAMQCSTCCSWAALLLLFYFCSRFCLAAFHAALQFTATYM